MPEQTITLHHGSDEAITLTVGPSPPDDISLATLRFTLKPDVCTSDTDASVLVFYSTVPGQISISVQTPALIVATVFIPAAAIAEPYSRVWRLDLLWGWGATHRTVLYGPAVIIDL